ncbi:MAG: 16S rRNA (guanine(527)-N(7))-methyltransferase RsmG [Vicinamibacterales bacterium]
MSARKLRDRILRRAKAAGAEPSTELVDGLVGYYSELAKWNAKVNLTAFSLDREGSDPSVDRLLIEPLLASRHLTDGVESLIDVGSGGGSPAIPLKLACPELALHMVEAKVRKSVFLRQVSRSLGLANTTVYTARFEELLIRSDLHEGMGAVSIRAVRLDSKVLMTLQAFLRPGGVVMHFTTGASHHAPPPPLVESGSFDLIPANRSRLVLFRKELIGR